MTFSAAKPISFDQMKCLYEELIVKKHMYDSRIGDRRADEYIVNISADRVELLTDLSIIALENYMKLRSVVNK